MKIILVYDVGVERVAKVLSICRQYLNWLQNSFFEGELTKAELEKLKFELSKVIDPTRDSIYIYKFPFLKDFDKEILGKRKTQGERGIFF